MSKSEGGHERDGTSDGADERATSGRREPGRQAMSDRRGSPERELGRRLARLREAAGLTQRELARRLGVDQSALSRIESGRRRLTAAQAGQAARILGVEPGALLGTLSEPQGEPFQYAGADEPARYGQTWRRPDGLIDRDLWLSKAAAAGDEDALTEDDALEPPQESGLPPLHELAAMAAPMLVEGPETGWRRAVGTPGLEPPLFAEVVRDALEVEALVDGGGSTSSGARTAAGAAGRTAVPSSPFATLPPATQADPVRLARFWRHELGVGDGGPLPDLVPLLESAGVDVVHARLEVSVPEGVCALVPRPWPSAPPRAFVFVNGRERPVVMQRFALAHEFAHLALGHGEAYDERIDWSGRSRRETDANAFAEEFVAPVAAVRRWADLTAPSPNDLVETVVHLANHFGISVWVARNRLRAAGLLAGPTASRALDQQLRAQEGRLTALQPFLGGLRDTLSVLTTESRPGAEHNPWRIAPLGVRVPGRMREQVLGLLQSGESSVTQSADWLRIGAADLDAQLQQLRG